MKSLRQFQLKNLNIDTAKQAILFVRPECHICQQEGFEVMTRVKVSLHGHSVMAIVNTVGQLLEDHEASLSTYAWDLLNAKEGEWLDVNHVLPQHSLGHLRSKIFGETLQPDEMSEIVQDIAQNAYADVEMAAFLTACAGGRLSLDEITAMTHAMIEAGQRLHWAHEQIVDKHCVGGLPGNRTSMIVVPIVAAYGLTIPKTSSRAITSPAGTADTMEMFAPVDLELKDMQKVVEKELGCIVWGGRAQLSPADDILIRVERVLDLDIEGQLVASVLSKKIAAGSSDILIDIPVGPTAKVRDLAMQNSLQHLFESVGANLNVNIRTHISDGTQPVGNGIGPALEARDVWRVLNNTPDAPQDLKERALTLAGLLIEFDRKLDPGQGIHIAQQILHSNQALEKFIAICNAQGGLRQLTPSLFQETLTSSIRGVITQINNRRLARLAKLAGAPRDPWAGIDLHVKVGAHVEPHQPLMTVHANKEGHLLYAISFWHEVGGIFTIDQD